MKLLYLTKANLKDKPFIHDLAFHFDKKGKAIILHDLFGPEIEDTHFVTKRLSAVLSEAMVVNFSVSGDQKNLISGNSAEPVLRSELIHKAFETVSVFITNRLNSSSDNEGADPVALISLIRKEFDIQEVLLFPANYGPRFQFPGSRLKARTTGIKCLLFTRRSAKCLNLPSTFCLQKLFLLQR